MRSHKRKPALTDEIRKVVKDARIVLVIDDKGGVHTINLEEARVTKIKRDDLGDLRVKRIRDLIPLSLLRFEGSDCWVIADGSYVNICDD